MQETLSTTFNDVLRLNQPRIHPGYRKNASSTFSHLTHFNAIHAFVAKNNTPSVATWFAVANRHTTIESGSLLGGGGWRLSSFSRRRGVGSKIQLSRWQKR